MCLRLQLIFSVVGHFAQIDLYWLCLISVLLSLCGFFLARNSLLRLLMLLRHVRVEPVSVGILSPIFAAINVLFCFFGQYFLWLSLVAAERTIVFWLLELDLVA